MKAPSRCTSRPGVGPVPLRACSVRNCRCLRSQIGRARMKRSLVPTVFTIFVSVIFAILAPLALAQAPAPKVTITGLFDQVTAGGKNFYDGNLSRDGDREWYARTRFRPDFVFEVGRTKAVMGLELDLTYGAIGQRTGGPGKNVQAGFSPGGLTGNQVDAHGGTTADPSLNTDGTR